MTPEEVEKHKKYIPLYSQIMYKINPTHNDITRTLKDVKISQEKVKNLKNKYKKQRRMLRWIR
ncbi:hypothetical protein [Mycoplasma capricolum]|uniref:hypothetical protein n=1 Tax=Mycoplasma capricolum TaxID=2095 RepID=UPI003DA1F5B0